MFQNPTLYIRGVIVHPYTTSQKKIKWFDSQDKFYPNYDESIQVKTGIENYIDKGIYKLQLSCLYIWYYSWNYAL